MLCIVWFGRGGRPAVGTMGEVTTDPVRPIRPALPGGARRDWGVLVFPAVLAITAGAAIACANAASPVGVWVFVFVMGGWLITLCLHEFAHAAVALAGGDTSVRGRGYLTLNPLRYTNAAMTFVLPLIILAVGGVPLPGGAVLIEHGRIRSAVARAAVSAAGPLTNLAAGIVLALVSTSLPQVLGVAVSYLALLQFVAAILNLIPVPGLDGWGIVAPFLSAKTLTAVRPFTPWAPLVLIVLLVSVPNLAQPLWDASFWLLETFGGSPTAASIGSGLFRFWV